MDKEDKEDKCDLCKGAGVVGTNECPFCNGTGEWNQAAQAYVLNHICQCIVWDRRFCPVCLKACHHDTSNSPKQTIDPGFGGISSGDPGNKDETVEMVFS